MERKLYLLTLEALYNNSVCLFDKSLLIVLCSLEAMICLYHRNSVWWDRDGNANCSDPDQTAPI